MEWIELYAKLKVFEAVAGIVFIVSVLVGYFAVLAYVTWKNKR